MFNQIENLEKHDEKHKTQQAADQIFRIIKSEFGYSKEQIISRCRDQDLVFFRMSFCAILKKHSNCSLKEVGKHLGGRDHATVLNALKRHEIKTEVIPNTYPVKYNDEHYVYIFNRIYYRYIQTNNTEESLVERKKLIYHHISELQLEINEINQKLNTIQTVKKKVETKTSWMGPALLLITASEILLRMFV